MPLDQLPNYIIQKEIELAYSSNYESIIMIEKAFLPEIIDLTIRDQIFCGALLGRMSPEDQLYFR
jgi:hypothetical protein